MDRNKITAILTMFLILFATAAVSGCTGSMTVSPTPVPTAAPTAAPTAIPAAAPTVAPTAAATVQPTPAATATPTALPTGTLKLYPTIGPWTPGDDTFIPTPTPYAAYTISSPWVDLKIQTPEPGVLKVTGNIANPMFLTMSDLEDDNPQLTSTWVNTANASKSFTATGPDLNALIDAAGPNVGATSIKLISSDGASYTLALADLRADPQAIVGILDDGTLRTCIPSQSAGKAQLRGLIQIQVI